VVLPTAVLGYRFSEISLATSLMTEWHQSGWGPVVPFLGARVALLLMTRKFDDGALPEQSFATVSPGLFTGARLNLSDRWSVVVRGRLHYLLYNIDEANRSLGYWELATLASYDFGGGP
jgi:hypothetical protein